MTDTQNPVAEAEAQTPAVDTTTNEQGEQTFENLVGETPAEQGEVKPQPEKDPRDSLIVELKQERREDRKLIMEMKTAIEAIAAAQKAGNKDGVQEAKDELELLAEEYGVDPTFMKKLEKTLNAKHPAQTPSSVVDAAVNVKMDEERRRAKLDADLEGQFEAALKMDPRYESIAKKDVVLKYIKNTVLTNKEEMKKTMIDVFEDLYGHVVKDAGVEIPGSKGSNYEEPINYAKPTEKDYKEIRKVIERTGKIPEDYTASLFARAGVQLRPKKN